MGNPTLLLSDASKIAALSGMRLEEIARLKVEHCTGGIMRVTDAKTTAGIRSVPIHTDIAPIIERRCAGKPPGAYLFDELKTPPKGSAMERGQPITKAFVSYRRRLKVDDRQEGERQSRVDFHSYRRWFAAKARDALQCGAAGYDQWTIAGVLGHDTTSSGAALSMTMGVYAGAQSVEAKRACVEAVKLPPV